MARKQNAVLNQKYRKAISELAAQRGLSEYALAKKLGWAESLLYYRVQRASRLRLETLQEIAEALGIDASALISDLERIK